MPDDAPAEDTLESKLENLRRVQRRIMNRWALRTFISIVGAEIFVSYFPEVMWFFWFIIILGVAELLIRLCLLADAKRKILAQHNPNSFDA